ncbi:MAG: GNAT family N-acetyltransferase [Chloroflexi bacterium]|nr:GNAT family N-acetyltransferase [Chloroflexota bacterium]MDA1148003.1 GNAT family N-acetyltransferase [Chloroflexota bacterium]
MEADAPLDIPVVTTERLRLEPLAVAHSAGIYALWSDPAVCQYSGTVTDYDRNIIPMPAESRAESDRIIDFWIRAAADGWGFRWAVLIEDGRAFAGTVGFNSLGTPSEIAYHLLPTSWGQGVMSEASAAAIAWRRTRGPAAIEAFIEPDNTPSITIAERLGLAATDEISEGARRYLLPA